MASFLNWNDSLPEPPIVEDGRGNASMVIKYDADGIYGKEHTYKRIMTCGATSSITEDDVKITTIADGSVYADSLNYRTRLIEINPSKLNTQTYGSQVLKAMRVDAERYVNHVGYYTVFIDMFDDFKDLSMLADTQANFLGVAPATNATLKRARGGMVITNANYQRVGSYYYNRQEKDALNRVGVYQNTPTSSNYMAVQASSNTYDMSTAPANFSPFGGYKTLADSGTKLGVVTSYANNKDDVLSILYQLLRGKNVSASYQTLPTKEESYSSNAYLSTSWYYSLHYFLDRDNTSSPVNGLWTSTVNSLEGFAQGMADLGQPLLISTTGMPTMGFDGTNFDKYGTVLGVEAEEFYVDNLDDVLTDMYSYCVEKGQTSSMEAIIKQGILIYYLLNFIVDNESEIKHDPEPSVEGFSNYTEVWIGQNEQNTPIFSQSFVPDLPLDADPRSVKLLLNLDYTREDRPPSWDDDGYIEIDTAENEYAEYSDDFRSLVEKRLGSAFNPNTLLTEWGFMAILWRLTDGTQTSNTCYLNVKANGEIGSYGFLEGTLTDRDKIAVNLTDHIPEDDDEEDDNPDPDIEPIIIPTIGTKTYVTTPTVINQLLYDMWHVTSVEDWILDLAENPMSNIVNVKLFPCDLKSLLTSETQIPIVIGNGEVSPNVTGYVNTLNSLISSDWKLVPKYNGFNGYEFLNYAPFTNVDIYLPFVGFVPLITNEVMGKYVSVSWGLDIATGRLSSQVWAKSSEDKNPRLVYETESDFGIDIPMSDGGMAQTMARLMGVGKQALERAGSMDVSGAIEGYLSAKTYNVNEGTQMSGSLSPVTQLYNQLQPYLRVSYPRVDLDSLRGYRASYGLPCNKSLKLTKNSVFNGFTVCSNVECTIPRATSEENAEIKRILESGFYL